MSITERHVRPHDLAAERAVLGGVIIENEAIGRVLEYVRAEDYYREAHRKIFARMLELYQENRPIDLVTLSESLSAQGQLEEIGGIAYLSALPDSVPITTNLANYAQIIREKSQLRALLDAQDEIHEAIANGAKLETVHRRVEQMAALVEPSTKGSSLVTIQVAVEALSRHQDRQEEAKQRSETGLTVQTPWPMLNKIFGGGWRGGRRPYVIAAQEGVGKTQVLIKAMLHAALCGIPALLFELELNHIQTVSRFAGLLAHINPGRIEQWTGLSREEAAEVIRVMGVLYELPLWIDGRTVKQVMGYSAQPACRPREMRSRIERLERDGVRIGIVGIDYLQKMNADQASGDERRDIVQISGAMSEWATEVEWPMIELAQCLSRDNDRQDAPTAKSIYGSSQIAKDASTVIMADRPSLRKTPKQRGDLTPIEKEEAILAIDKTEHGQTGVVEIRHDAVCGDWVPVWTADEVEQMARNEEVRSRIYSDKVIYGTGHDDGYLESTGLV